MCRMKLLYRCRFAFCAVKCDSLRRVRPISAEECYVANLARFDMRIPPFYYPMLHLQIPMHLRYALPHPQHPDVTHGPHSKPAKPPTCPRPKLNAATTTTTTLGNLPAQHLPPRRHLRARPLPGLLRLPLLAALQLRGQLLRPRRPATEERRVHESKCLWRCNGDVVVCGCSPFPCPCPPT